MRKLNECSFDRRLYSSPDEVARFHSTICGMFKHLRLKSTKPSLFHRFMNELARKSPHFRHYTQNIDCLEHRLRHLKRKTVRLHGRIDKARCPYCSRVYKFRPRLFRGADSPDCQRCLKRSQARAKRGMRSLCTNKLRPDVLLYGEPHPDDGAILEAVDDTLRTCPDLVLVVGTKLQVPGAKAIAKDFCRAARSVGGASVWINKEEPASNVKDLFDHVILGDCDELVSTLFSSGFEGSESWQEPQGERTSPCRNFSTSVGNSVQESLPQTTCRQVSGANRRSKRSRPSQASPPAFLSNWPTWVQ